TDAGERDLLAGVAAWVGAGPARGSGRQATALISTRVSGSAGFATPAAVHPGGCASVSARGIARCVRASVRGTVRGGRERYRDHAEPTPGHRRSGHRTAAARWGVGGGDLAHPALMLATNNW